MHRLHDNPIVKIILKGVCFLFVLSFGSFIQGHSNPHASQTDLLQKETELRAALKSLRTAISEYKDLCDKGAMLGPFDRTPVDKCYPPSLGTLTGGVTPPGKQYRIIFLDQIPTDPMTGSQDWGLRSFQDDKQAEAWGRQNVFSVYSKSDKLATDGTLYLNW